MGRDFYFKALDFFWGLAIALWVGLVLACLVILAIKHGFI